MLKNAYLDANIGVDTAENEPSDVEAKQGLNSGAAAVVDGDGDHGCESTPQRRTHAPGRGRTTRGRP